MLKCCTLIKRNIFPGPNVKCNIQSSVHYVTQKPISLGFLYSYYFWYVWLLVCHLCWNIVKWISFSSKVTNLLMLEKANIFLLFGPYFIRVQVIACWCFRKRNWMTLKYILMYAIPIIPLRIQEDQMIFSLRHWSWDDQKR